MGESYEKGDNAYIAIWLDMTGYVRYFVNIWLEMKMKRFDPKTGIFECNSLKYPNGPSPINQYLPSFDDPPPQKKVIAEQVH